MKYTGNLKNSRILVKDTVNDTVMADTFITDYNPHTRKIKISASSLLHRKEGKVLVLVFINNRIYEFEGTIYKAVIANEVEIGIVSGKQKERRKYSRYDVETEGIVGEIWLCNQMVSLRKPIQIKTKDISAGGVRFMAAAGSFELGYKIQLLFHVKEHVFQKEYKIVRVQNSGVWTEEYGCRMIR